MRPLAAVALDRGPRLLQSSIARHRSPSGSFRESRLLAAIVLTHFFKACFCGSQKRLKDMEAALLLTSIIIESQAERRK